MRERAVRMVLDGAGEHESRWAAIVSISSKIGCARQTLNEWVKKVEVDISQRDGITTEQAEKNEPLSGCQYKRHWFKRWMFRCFPATSYAHKVATDYGRKMATCTEGKWPPSFRLEALALDVRLVYVFDPMV